MDSQKTNVDRIIYYYNLKFHYFKDHEDNKPYNDIFHHINKLNKEKKTERIISARNGRIFCSALQFYPNKSQIHGKLYYVREDVLPEIINLTDENIREFQLSSEEGMLETTHFILKYEGDEPELGIEYNHFGAHVGDLVHYIKLIGKGMGITRNCEAIMVIQDRLKEIRKHIKRFSKVKVKVLRDNIKKVNSIDTGLGTALYQAQNFSLADEVEISLKFDYQKRESTTSIKDAINNFIDSFIKQKPTINYFETFELTAENIANNNQLEVFNLLLDRVRSDIVVKKKLNGRVIVSRDFFEQCENEMIKIFKLH